jgi:hypothetical protein
MSHAEPQEGQQQPAPVRQRERELIISLYGIDRSIGVFDSSVHTSLRNVVLMLKREISGKGRPVKVSETEKANVQTALAAGTGVAETIEDLKQQIWTWREDKQWDARSINGYYDRYSHH